MVKISKAIVITLLTIIIYFTITIISDHILYTQNNSIYILNRDVTRGQTITDDMIDTVKLVKSKNNLKYCNKDEIINMIVNDNYYKGQAITSDILITKEEYKENTNEKEIICIDLDGSDILALNEVNNNGIINIYYTCSRSEISNLNLDKMLSKNFYVDDKYITFKLIEKIQIKKVINKYDDSMNNILSKSILLEVDPELAIKIKNIKNYGTFSFSI